MEVAYKEILTEILKRTFSVAQIEIPTNYVSWSKNKMLFLT
jgi:hypothetical protein